MLKLLKKLILFFYNPIIYFWNNKIIKVSHQRNFDERTKKKWELIKSELPDVPGSLLDIGCAEGHFTLNSSKLGWVAWGIDGKENAIKYARKQADKIGLDSAFFSEGIVLPDSSSKLPSFDVILFLSSYHQISKKYSEEKAVLVLRNLLNKCTGKIIFEPASVNRKYSNNVFNTDNDLTEITEWVRKIVPKEWNVRLSDKIKYNSEETYRYIFVLEK